MRGLRQAASRAALLAVVLCLASAGATSIATAKRVALVIGNGAYANAPTLPNPPNDAKAIAADLEKLGFEVHLALDVTQEKGLATLDEFAAALPGAEAAVFFYSGHGMQIDGDNFLLPVDVVATSERTVRARSIDISEIVRDMEENADVTIVMLDACRDNPFAEQLQQSTPRSRSAAATRGLAVIKPSGNGSIIAYAAAAGATASDGATEHSPYTAALLKYHERAECRGRLDVSPRARRRCVGDQQRAAARGADPAHPRILHEGGGSRGRAGRSGRAGRASCCDRRDTARANDRQRHRPKASRSGIPG